MKAVREVILTSQKGDGIRLKISYNLQRYYVTENIFHRALFFS